VKIRNPKHEIRNNLKIEKSNFKTQATLPLFGFSTFPALDLFRISCFGFRIFNFQLGE